MDDARLENTRDIERIISFEGKISLGTIREKIGARTWLPLVCERHYYDESEGGGYTDTYYLELTERQFNMLNGELSG
jgi:hypothetical protein